MRIWMVPVILVVVRLSRCWAGLPGAIGKDILEILPAKHLIALLVCRIHETRYGSWRWCIC